MSDLKHYMPKYVSILLR